MPEFWKPGASSASMFGRRTAFRDINMDGADLLCIGRGETARMTRALVIDDEQATTVSTTTQNGVWTTDALGARDDSQVPRNAQRAEAV